jgi:hypothetical protein
MDARSLEEKQMSKTFDTQLAARKFMNELKAKGIKFSYWHRSVCEHVVTVQG